MVGVCILSSCRGCWHWCCHNYVLLPIHHGRSLHSVFLQGLLALVLSYVFLPIQYSRSLHSVFLQGLLALVLSYVFLPIQYSRSLHSVFLQGLLALVLYAVLRNACLVRCLLRQKSYYTTSNAGHTDIATLPPPSLSYSNRMAINDNDINMTKGSRTSLINDVSGLFFSVCLYCVVS